MADLEGLKEAIVDCIDDVSDFTVHIDYDEDQITVRIGGVTVEDDACIVPAVREYTIDYHIVAEGSATVRARSEEEAERKWLDDADLYIGADIEFYNGDSAEVREIRTYIDVH